MNETTLLYVMTAFVIISAIALCIQAGMLAGMYKTTKAMQEKINPLVPKVESLGRELASDFDRGAEWAADHRDHAPGPTIFWIPPSASWPLWRTWWATRPCAPKCRWSAWSWCWMTL